jgi:hypothetical protein
MKRLLALAFVLAICLGACDANTQAYQFVNSFVKTWTGHTMKETLRYTLGIPTGSSLKDDFIDQQRADDTFEVAQKLYEAALAQNSREFLETATDLIDQAIKLQPNDYRFRITRASLAMQQADLTGMSFQLSEAFTKVENPSSVDGQKETEKIRDAEIAEFEKLAARLKFHNRGPCEGFYAELRDAYHKRNQSAGAQAGDLDAERRYDAIYQQCATLPF